MSSLKLARLLDAQGNPDSSASLSKNFGDTYLLKHNRIFAKIRECVLADNYTFSHDLNEAYLALPLSQLENILETKTIPYVDNVSVLRKLNSRVEIFWEEIQDNLRKNYVFHESCHAVARSLGGALEKPLQAEERVLRILLEESFANTCELLAVVDVKDQLHRVFYEWNAYTFLFHESTHLTKAIEDMGTKAIFKFLLLSYLRANFLALETNERDFSRIVALALENALTDAKKIKTLRYLSKICFTLDAGFREVTTGLHLRLNGLQNLPTGKVCFDFLTLIENQTELQALISSMAASALSPDLQA